MHDLYMEGYSLSQVAKAHGVTRQSVYDRFARAGKPMRVKKRLPYIMFNGSKYTIRNNGYYAKTNGKRTSLHRDVWEHFNETIPDGWDIHHIDGDKENNAIENLECLPKAEHTRKYSPHHNQYTKRNK